MQSVVEVMNTAEQNAVENQEIRDMRKNCPNLKGGRQGDVYVIRVDTAKDVAKLEAIINKNKNKRWSNFTFGTKLEVGGNQLAIGTTKGSRHVFNGKGVVKFSKDGHPCAGGIIEAKSEWTLEHPEHAHFMFPEGRYAFFYQLDASKEKEVRRVQD